MLDLSKELLPNDAREGDVIEIQIDREETDKREDEIEKMCEGLWE